MTGIRIIELESLLIFSESADTKASQYALAVLSIKAPDLARRVIAVKGTGRGS